MQFFTREAATYYAELSWIEFDFKIIGITHYISRAAAFMQLAEPSDSRVADARNFLSEEEWPMHDDWASSPDENTGSPPLREEEGSRTTGEGRGRLGRPNRQFPYLTPVGALKNWEFHLTDNDFFPSIPHAHWLGRLQPKLDAYLGWVYKGAVQQSRVKREGIVELWNEEKFRKFAAEAIDYYFVHYPDYRWRVPDPRRLPRRRKW